MKQQPFTLAQLRMAHTAMLEADQRAKNRGLTKKQMDAEAEDDDSQYWEDVREIMATAKNRRVN